MVDNFDIMASQRVALLQKNPKYNDFMLNMILKKFSKSKNSIILHSFEWIKAFSKWNLPQNYVKKLINLWQQIQKFVVKKVNANFPRKIKDANKLLNDYLKPGNYYFPRELKFVQKLDLINMSVEHVKFICLVTGNFKSVKSILKLKSKQDKENAECVIVPSDNDETMLFSTSNVVRTTETSFHNPDMNVSFEHISPCVTSAVPQIDEAVDVSTYDKEAAETLLSLASQC